MGIDACLGAVYMLDFFETIFSITIFFTPIIFIISFVKTIEAVVKKKDYRILLTITIVSFWLIIVPSIMTILNMIQNYS